MLGFSLTLYKRQVAVNDRAYIPDLRREFPGIAESEIDALRTADRRAQGLSPDSVRPKRRGSGGMWKMQSASTGLACCRLRSGRTRRISICGSFRGGVDEVLILSAELCQYSGPRAWLLAAEPWAEVNSVFAALGLPPKTPAFLRRETALQPPATTQFNGTSNTERSCGYVFTGTDERSYDRETPATTLAVTLPLQLPVAFNRGLMRAGGPSDRDKLRAISSGCRPQPRRNQVRRRTCGDGTRRGARAANGLPRTGRSFEEMRVASSKTISS